VDGDGAGDGDGEVVATPRVWWFANVANGNSDGDVNHDAAAVLCRSRYLLPTVVLKLVNVLDELAPC